MNLYRPVGLEELRLVFEAEMLAFPRLPRGQSIFDPVLTEEHARQVASEWSANTDSRAAFVTRFVLDDEYAARFERHLVGSPPREELWIPADELEMLNEHLVGEIEVVAAFFGDGWREEAQDPRAIARVLDWLALTVDDLDLARRLMDETLALYRSVAAVDPSRRGGLAMVLAHEAIICAMEERPEQEAASREECIGLLRAALLDEPDEQELQAELASQLAKRGRARAARNEVEGGRADADEAWALLRVSAEEDADALESIAKAYLDLADWSAARAAYDEALAIHRRRRATGPDDAEVAGDIAGVLLSLGVTAEYAHDFEAARQRYAEMRDEYAAACRRFPDDADLASACVWNLRFAAKLHEGLGELDAALALRKECLENARTAAARHPSIDSRDEVRFDLMYLGDLLALRDERPHAADAYWEAVAIARGLAADEPENRDWLVSIAWALASLRDALDGGDSAQERLAAAREVVALQRQIAGDDPTDLEMLRELLVDLDTLGDCLCDAGDRDSAGRAYVDAEAIARGLVAMDASNTRWRDDLSIVLGRRGSLALDAHDSRAAVDAFVGSADELRVLVRSGTDDARWRHKLGERLADVGEAHSESGDLEAALAAYAEAVPLLLATRSDVDGRSDDTLRDVLVDAADAAAAAGRPDLAQRFRSHLAEIGEP